MISESTNKKPTRYIVWFFVIAFLITWLFYLPKVLVDNDLMSVPGGLLLLRHVAFFGPFVAAFVLTFLADRWQGVRALWKRGWDFRFDPKWLIPVLLLPPLTSGLTVLAVRLFGGQIAWEYRLIPLSPFMAAIFLLIYLTQALPEEYGWRGYALDRLQSRWGALAASLVLGFLWGLWHLPLHFAEGTTQAIIPVWQFILKQMLGAVIYTWIYNYTQGNVFLAILYHTIGNMLGGLVPFWVTAQGRWLNFGIELVIVAIIVAVYGAKTLTRPASPAVTDDQ